VGKSVLLIYEALARPFGRAPTCMFEPSLTVGLVPRIASRVVAIHIPHYPEEFVLDKYSVMFDNVRANSKSKEG
jgi:hypothetical protein